MQALVVMALLHNVEPLSGDVIKPANDKLEYKVITLDNGLRALLVHDAETDKAAAALDVSTAKKRHTAGPCYNDRARPPPPPCNSWHVHLGPWPSL